ncbi:helix-turn-helix transcriptional regulator [Kitasatospora sp. MMS16-BH015]|uniref:helix-turn-helix transcriptional regulator n=1 Tax=Kitasatospora sp. MMS16-BH015 TaxID=2018025 RepID=UPI000CA24B7E|nr:LuxR C-terminal-related transcriptional regulator [Kitasatospora sp. MMS16-BH015]AUG75816.1 helix-turn-helix transcriptional regulator [Kitasatospora sp. MMS16-BH015]
MSQHSPDVPVPAALRGWDLSADADLVYRHLVLFGARTAPAVARELSLTRRRTEHALEELWGTDTVVRSGRAGPRPAERWTARPVEQVVAELRLRKRRLVDPVELARGHAAVLGGITLSPADPTRRGAARALYGRAAVVRRIDELSGLERREHLSMNPVPYIDAAVLAAAAPGDLALLARGVAVKVLGVTSTMSGLPDQHNHDLLAHGAKCRLTDRLPIKMQIFDRAVALLPIDPLEPAAGALEIGDPELVAALVQLYERTWSLGSEESAAAEAGADPLPDMELTDREYQIVVLMTAGRSDAAVADALGISLRTIGYTLRSLMDRYGAENRFQLGVLLGSQLPTLREELNLRV